ncbi:MAG: thioredoxin family protein [Phycisphaerales bacterium]|nr:thioredoxin family protein [Phycisphaerales bacterium]
MTSSRFAPARSLLAALVAGLFALPLAACDKSAPQKDTSTSPQEPVGPLADRHAPPPGAGESWNAAKIEWFTYDGGLEEAKATKKPICLVFFTTWCPHCKNYSRVFEDPKVTERAKDFVMVRVDADQESDLAKRFSKDGGYIPRTFFLSSDGTPDFEIHAARPQYAYFYDERNPGSILAGMEEAARKLRN